ncbi:S4 domain-containing protein [Hellea sp.]|nr:S4 domain-containing protein [Hellea sp.]
MGRQFQKTTEDVFKDESCRLDVWLYRTRIFKTRSLANKMILAGKIRVTRNGHTVRTRKPGLHIKPGENVTFMRGQKLMHIEMLKVGTRRGPAPEAQSLYRDHSPA